MATRLTVMGQQLPDQEVSTDGRTTAITPVRADSRARKLEQVVRIAHEQYAGAFRRLAE